MVRRRAAAALLALLIGTGFAACDGEGDTDVDSGPGQSTEEDPTLGDPDGGGTTDEGTEGTGGDDSTDGSDEGTPGSGGASNGSGTGAGRGDG